MVPPPGNPGGGEWEVETLSPGSSFDLWPLKRHWGKILCFVATCIIATVLVSARLTPLYEASAVIEIDRRMPAAVLGQESLRYPELDADEFLGTQVELLRSDPVLRPVIQKYRLLSAEVKSGGCGQQKPAPSVTFQEAPLKLPGLKVARVPRTYLLRVSYRAADPHFAAEVANAIVNSYIEQIYNIRYRSTLGLSSFMEKQLEELKAQMERSGAALAQFEQELNVIDPEERTNILSAQLLQLNTEYTSAQADRVRKEAAYHSAREGSLDALQSSSQGEGLKKLLERLSEAREKFAEIKPHYGVNHPEYRKAAAQVAQLEHELDQMRRSTLKRVEIAYQEAVNREGMLKRAVAETKAEIDRLHARSIEYQALKREAEADKRLYEELVRKIKEAGINAGFRNSIVRLAAAARPPAAPTWPNLSLNAALALVFSILLAIGVTFFVESRRNTVRDTEHLRSLVPVPVLGALPAVRAWSHNGPKPLLPEGAGAQVSARTHPEVIWFQEALASMRNRISLGADSRSLRSFTVTSTMPNEGKTTVALHLALANARAGRKTLLIDGDLRKPNLQAVLGATGSAGLAEVLYGGANWRALVRQSYGLLALDVLFAGSFPEGIPPFSGEQWATMLREATAQYETVIVDSPPFGLFPETLLMTKYTDGTLLTVAPGRTSLKSVGSALEAIQDLGARLVGIIVNQDTGGPNGYSYYKKYYYKKYYKMVAKGSDRDGKNSPPSVADNRRAYSGRFIVLGLSSGSESPAPNNMASTVSPLLSKLGWSAHNGSGQEPLDAEAQAPSAGEMGSTTVVAGELDVSEAALAPTEAPVVPPREVEQVGRKAETVFPAPRVSAGKRLNAERVARAALATGIGISVGAILRWVLSGRVGRKE